MEVHPFKTDIHTNAFTGDPRPELDDAWHEFLKSEGTLAKNQSLR